MKTTPEGWLIAFTVLGVVIILRSFLFPLLMSFKKKKVNKQYEFEKRISEMNDIDDLIDLRNETKQPDLVSMIDRKLNRLIK